jgi:hypothetical protein
MLATGLILKYNSKNHLINKLTLSSLIKINIRCIHFILNNSYHKKLHKIIIINAKIIHRIGQLPRFFLHKLFSRKKSYIIITPDRKINNSPQITSLKQESKFNIFPTYKINPT